MAIAPLTTKFVRYMHFTQQFSNFVTAPEYGGQDATIFKILYEFWGFCVNGGTSLTIPGGFAPINGVMLPQSMQSGTMLIASGSDGSTELGSSYFSASNIPPLPQGLSRNVFLVTWKSGSTSTDDSIYRVLQRIDSGTIRVDTQSGGTPQTGSLIPSFTTRTAINWRLIDFNQTIDNASFSMSGSSSLVFQFDGAGYVNPGQDKSQIRLQTSPVYAGTFTGYRLDLVWTISPSGSWNGSAFSDAGSSITSTPQPFDSNRANGGGQAVAISLWGAQDFLHVAMTSGILNGSPHFYGYPNCMSAFHIEIPQRLYPQANDSNLITFATTEASTGYLFTTTGTPASDFFALNAWHMLDNLNTTRKFILTTKSWSSPVISGYTVTVPNGGTMSSLLATPLAYNQFLNKHLVSDGILSCPLTPGFFCLARARLRRIKFMPQTLPNLTKIGSDGSQLLIQNGVVLPWDNALLTTTMFPYGVGPAA